MALEDYKANMERCSRCSYCKWIPFAFVKSWRFAQGCPSISYNNFQAYSASGKLSVALGLLEKRFDYTESDKLLDIAYQCVTCGSCDVACKIGRYNMEPLETIHELRFRLVEDGQLLPQHMLYIDNLRKEDNMLLKPKSCSRQLGRWTGYQANYQSTC